MTYDTHIPLLRITSCLIKYYTAREQITYNLIFLSKTFPFEHLCQKITVLGTYRVKPCPVQHACPVYFKRYFWSPSVKVSCSFQHGLARAKLFALNLSQMQFFEEKET